MLAAISRGIVQLMRRTAGKGPTKARAHWAGSDAIVVVLQGGCLRAEQTLQEAGMARTVEATRRALQEALESDMCELVEGLSGRRVAEFLSATRRDSDTTAEVFLLAPDEAP